MNEAVAGHTLCFVVHISSRNQRLTLPAMPDTDNDTKSRRSQKPAFDNGPHDLHSYGIIFYCPIELF